jgi:hypothetical protein
MSMILDPLGVMRLSSYRDVRNTVWNGRFLHRLLLEKIRQAAYGLVWRQECHSELL